MILGLPVQDGHDLTRASLESLAKTVRGETFKVVIIDNNSTEPYKKSEFADLPLKVDIIRNKKNMGYYYPLIQLHDRYPSEALIGLMHNDMLLYEEGWNQRMEECFNQDDKLALVGLCGSNEVDERGGRGGGTACFFRGEKGQSQAAGARIFGLMPSACLDSLFMMFARTAVPALHEDWENLPLAHFYDRIMPLRLVEQGLHVATLGVECDHMGGMTTVANPRYYEDCKTWLEERGIPYENPETEMYLVAERRYLSEYREQKAFIPCRIREDYSYERIAY